MTAPNRTHGVTCEELERACRSKNRYPDRYTAVAMGISQAERYGDKLYTYRCPVCEGWHLTKSKHGRNGNPVMPCTEDVFKTRKD